MGLKQILFRLLHPAEARVVDAMEREAFRKASVERNWHLGKVPDHIFRYAPEYPHLGDSFCGFVYTDAVGRRHCGRTKDEHDNTPWSGID